MDFPLLKGDSVEELLDIILKALNDLVEYELAVILKLKNKETLTVQKARGPLSSEEIEHFQINLASRRDIADMIARREPYLFPEEEDHVDTYQEILDMPEGHSCLVAPLYFKETPVGMLTLDHRVCRKYSPGIVRFIASISKLISIILTQGDTSRYLLEQQRLLTEERNRLLRFEGGPFRGVIGRSPRWQDAMEGVRIVAGSNLAVLIQGETGTGKEEAARLIHRLSSQKDGPFIALNCSALSSGLAESELFGHEKGAFTGAAGRRKGRFELAHGGTLFLDEIGDLPADLQPKLLRALQEGVFERVGGEEPVRSDVRIIAATHVDLQKAVEKRAFREDLFYRLNVFPVSLPPLRERGEDVILLAEHFINTLKKEDYPLLKMGPGVPDDLVSYDWPGNVRQLYNFIRRGALVSGGSVIKREHLFPEDVVFSVPRQGSDPIISLDDAVARHIRVALERSQGKIYGTGGAAELLGLKPSTLQSKMKKLGIERTLFRQDI